MNIKLNEDYTISGDVIGTWKMKNDSYFMNIVIDGQVYKGAFIKQEELEDKVVCSNSKHKVFKIKEDDNNNVKKSLPIKYTIGSDDIIYDIDNNIVKDKWVEIDGYKYRSDQNGKTIIGWFEENGNWYNFNYLGKMNTGWLNDTDDKWYYLDEEGIRQTGWLKDVNGRVYYFNKSGDMKTGWLRNSDGRWYYLESNGELARDMTIDGYYVDENGICTR